MNRNFKVLSHWDEYIKYVPNNLYDVFYSTQYHKIYSKFEKSQPRAFIYKDDQNILIPPFLKRSLLLTYVYWNIIN